MTTCQQRLLTKMISLLRHHLDDPKPDLAQQAVAALAACHNMESLKRCSG